MDGLLKSSRIKAFFLSLFILSLFSGQLFAEGLTQNRVLIARAIVDLPEINPWFLEYQRLEQFGSGEISQVRILNEEDPAGSFQSMYEFDSKGNVIGIANAMQQTNISFTYNQRNQIRKISFFENGQLMRNHFFYYDAKGRLSKSVYSMFMGGSETEYLYDGNAFPTKTNQYKNWELTGSRAFKNNYNSKGQIVSIEVEGSGEKFQWGANGKLTRIERTDGMMGTAIELAYNDGKITSATFSRNEMGNWRKSNSVNYKYNSLGLLESQSNVWTDEGMMPEKFNFRYDNFSDKLASAHRGDIDTDASMGYGTPIIVTWRSPQADLTVLDSTYDIYIELRPGPGQEMPVIEDVVLRQDNQRTDKEYGKMWKERVGSMNLYEIEKRIYLNEGYNAIDIDVETELGLFKSAARNIRYRNPNRRFNANKLNILSIGMGEYSDQETSVEYADADAMDIIGAFQEKNGELYEEVNAKMLLNEAATKTDIEMQIRKMRNESDANDLTIIFFAGLGESADGEYYLKPHFAEAKPDDMGETAVSIRWILQEISRFEGPVVIMVDGARKAGDSPLNGETDAVHAVKAFNETITSDESLRLLMISSSGSQKSTSSEEWGNGAFTEAILTAMQGKGDSNSDGYISVEELEEFVAEATNEMTEGAQTPVLLKKGIGLVTVAKALKK